MSKKQKTMDKVIEELTGVRPHDTEENYRVMTNKMKALGESAKILGLDIMFLIRDPEHGMASGVYLCNKLPEVAEGDKWTYMAGLLRQLVLNMLDQDTDYVLPVLDAINHART